MIPDYHLHLRNPAEEIDHTRVAAERFADAARAVGVDEICLTEHVYYFRQTRSLWTVPYQIDRCLYDLDDYVEAVLAAKAAGLPVKLGLEVDYVPGREEETAEILAPYPWDFLLGSVHFIDGLGVDGPPRLIDEVGVEEGWRRYFETLRHAAASGLFDSLSHPDLVKMFGDRAADPVLDYERTAEAIAAAGVAVEVSTAGLRKPVRELYPDPSFLAACRERGVPITLASDAHVPDLVGKDFPLGLELARSAGYGTVTVFDGRRGRQEPLG